MQQSHQNLSNGLQSFADVSPDYELAPIGIGSIKDQAEKLAEYGRNGDIYIVHAAEGETVVPMEVLDANPKVRELLFGQMRDMGLDPQEFVVGSELNSINPSTGMPEFFFKKIFRAVKKAVKGVVNVVKKAAPIVLPIAATAFGVPFLSGLAPGLFGAGSIGAGFIGGAAGSLAGGNSLKDSLKSGLISGGIAGLTGGLKGAFNFGSPGPGGFEGFQRGLGETVGYYGGDIGFNPTAQLMGRSGATFGQQIDRFSDIFSGKESALGDFLGGKASEGYLPGGSADISYQQGVLPDEFAVSQRSPAEAFGAERGNLMSSSDVTRLPVSTVPKPATATDTLGTVGRKVRQLSPFAETSVESGGKTLYGTPAEDLIRKAAQDKVYSAAAAKNIPNATVFEAAMKAGEDAVKAAQPTMLQQYGPLAAAAGLTAYGLGAFDTPPPPDDPDESQLPGFGQPVGSELYAQDPGKYQVAQLYSDEAAKRLGLNYNYNPNQTQFVPVAQVAKGGIMSFPRREALVRGPGTERSDDIPAMLSDGEFVMTSKAVRGASPNPTGNKERDRQNGARNMYAMMRNFEMRA
jgi:hypothetical protein